MCQSACGSGSSRAPSLRRHFEVQVYAHTWSFHTLSLEKSGPYKSGSVQPHHHPFLLNVHIHNVIPRLRNIRTKKGTQLGDLFSMSKTTFVFLKPCIIWIQPNVQYLSIPRLTGMTEYLAAGKRTWRTSSCDGSSTVVPPCLTIISSPPLDCFAQFLSLYSHSGYCPGPLFPWAPDLETVFFKL